MSMVYEFNGVIPFSATLSSTNPTQVFTVPYGFNVRFKLLKINIFNTSGGALNVKFYDKYLASTITDPPTQGASATPLFQLSAATLQGSGFDLNTCRKWNFNQGLVAEASVAGVVVDCEVIEA